MNFEAVQQRYPISATELLRYHRAVLPPLNIAQLNAELLVGRNRRVLRTPITGDFSTVLRYKGKEGAVSSFEVRDGTDMVLQQLQGARSPVSWRVATAFKWDSFLMHDALEIAQMPESGVRRIAMPNPLHIKGIESAESEQAVERYRAFITFAALQWSQTDHLFVRDLKSSWR